MNGEEYINCFMRNLMNTNRTFDWFINFGNIEDLISKKELLDLLNCLIRAENFETIFYNLLKWYPNVVTVFPILLAISKTDRQNLERGGILSIFEKKVGNIDYYFGPYNRSLTPNEIRAYYVFFVNTGLQYLFQNKLAVSVYDYAVGALAGLDTNARKNRSGKIFETLCEEKIKNIAEDCRFEVRTQVNTEEILKSVAPDYPDKRFDFFLENGQCRFDIEVNFFNAEGSKPIEILDAYASRSEMLRNYHIGFILITDGAKWKTDAAKKKLANVYDKFYFMNYQMMCSGCLASILENARRSIIYTSI